MVIAVIYLRTSRQLLLFHGEASYLWCFKTSLPRVNGKNFVEVDAELVVLEFGSKIYKN